MMKKGKAQGYWFILKRTNRRERLSYKEKMVYLPIHNSAFKDYETLFHHIKASFHTLFIKTGMKRTWKKDKLIYLTRKKPKNQIQGNSFLLWMARIVNVEQIFISLFLSKTSSSEPFIWKLKMNKLIGIAGLWKVELPLTDRKVNSNKTRKRKNSAKRVYIDWNNSKKTWGLKFLWN